MMAGNKAQFKKLREDMKAARAHMPTAIVWNSTDADLAVAAAHKGRLLCVCHWAFQLCKASETYNYATALAKEDKSQHQELSLNMTNASEKEAQLAC